MFQQKLYQNLMQLVTTNEAFYYVDHVINNVIYRVFTYRLASYTDFLNPDALECRGHMFRLDGDAVKLVSLPFTKFFNINENPMTMDLDLSSINFAHDKRDGSLIATFKHDDMICLKSKTAIASDQALDATKVMHADQRLFDVITDFVNQDYTVIMEYTAPDNRIVLPYQNKELKILGVRNNKHGEYIDYEQLYADIPEYMVDDYTASINGTVEDFIASIPSMKGIEGFVIGLPSGQRIKIKTEEYLALHRAKDSVYSNKRLFEVVLNEASDDLRSMFHDDEYVINRITEMENIVGHAYNGLVNSVEQYYSNNKELDRKSYAIKGQQELTKTAFNLAMMKYTGKKPDYKNMLLKNFKDYIDDNEQDETI
jgi:RNA ligase